MMTISDLSRDLVGEILSRVPLSSLSAVRSTCKTWNDLSKNQILGQKAVKKNQFLEFMIIDSRVCSLRFDLRGILKDDDLVDHSMKQISIPNNEVVEISQVHHCDGLLLCVTKDHSSLVAWNPYLGETRLIRPHGNKFPTLDKYAFGYDNNNRNHKILRFCYDYENIKGGRKYKYLIHVYDFSSDSWRVLDANPHWDKPFYHSGVSLNGNTYFFGQEVTTMDGEEVTDIEDYLLCFDFTTERFGPRLPLPFHPDFPSFETVTLSWVRDEKLTVLYNHYDTYEIIEIWITTKIEPNAVSWSTFLTVDVRLINGLPDDFLFYFRARSFFIDEEKKVAVLFDLDRFKRTETFRYQNGYIVGEDAYFKSASLGVVSNPRGKPGKLVCSSYVPSLVQLQINQLGKRKEKD